MGSNPSDSGQDLVNVANKDVQVLTTSSEVMQKESVNPHHQVKNKTVMTSDNKATKEPPS